MSFELVNTSVPKGLKPGSRGFTTVAFTEGMPANYVQLCESLSGYIHVYGLEDPQYGHNPPAYSHLISTVGGRTFSVLSKVASYRKDYTGRSNKLAHHFMFKVEERTAYGPAVAMDGGQIFFDKWEEEPKRLPENRVSLKGMPTGLRAIHWEKAFGDPDMACKAAGALAQAFLDAPDRPSFIIFQPEVDLLPLIAEAQALLPEGRPWDVTFSTYFTALPVGMKCAWRCCLPKSDALVTARRTPGTLVINLIDKTIDGAPSDQSLAEVARTGNRKAPIAEITPPSPLPIQAAPVPSTPPPKAGVASPRRTLIPPDYGNVLKPKPPIQKRPIIGPIPIVISLLVIGGVAASFFISRDLFKGKAPESQVGQSQPPETETLHGETKQATAELSKPVAPSDQSSSDVTKEQKAEPSPAVKLPEKKVSYRHNDFKGNDGKKRVITAPASITFWNTKGETILTVQTNRGIDGTSYYSGKDQLAEYNNRKELSARSNMVGFLEANTPDEHIIQFVRPIQATYQLSPMANSVAMTLPDSDWGKQLTACISALEGRIPAEAGTFSLTVSVDADSRKLMASLSDQDILSWNGKKNAASNELDGWENKLAQIHQITNSISRLTNDYSELPLTNYFSAITNYAISISSAMNIAKHFLAGNSRAVGETTQLMPEFSKRKYDKPENKASPDQRSKEATQMLRKFEGVHNLLQEEIDQYQARVIRKIADAKNRMQALGNPFEGRTVQILLDDQPIVEATIK